MTALVRIKLDGQISALRQRGFRATVARLGNERAGPQSAASVCGGYLAYRTTAPATHIAPDQCSGVVATNLNSASFDLDQLRLRT
jgi:hypothetical protein